MTVNISTSFYEHNKTLCYLTAYDPNSRMRCYLERKGHKTNKYHVELRGIENTKNGYLSKNILHAAPFQAENIEEAKQKLLAVLDEHIASLNAIREAIDNHHFE